MVGQRKRLLGPDLPYQETSERKDRGASTLCVTPVRRRGRTRIHGQNFTTVLLLADKFVAGETMKIRSGAMWGNLFSLWHGRGLQVRPKFPFVPVGVRPMIAPPQACPWGSHGKGRSITQCVVSFCRFFFFLSWPLLSLALLNRIRRRVTRPCQRKRKKARRPLTPSLLRLHLPNLRKPSTIIPRKRLWSSNTGQSTVSKTMAQAARKRLRACGCKVRPGSSSGGRFRSAITPPMNALKWTTSA